VKICGEESLATCYLPENSEEDISGGGQKRCFPYNEGYKLSREHKSQNRNQKHALGGGKRMLSECRENKLGRRRRVGQQWNFLGRSDNCCEGTRKVKLNAARCRDCRGTRSGERSGEEKKGIRCVESKFLAKKRPVG